MPPSQRASANSGPALVCGDDHSDKTGGKPTAAAAFLFTCLFIHSSLYVTCFVLHPPFCSARKAFCSFGQVPIRSPACFLTCIIVWNHGCVHDFLFKCILVHLAFCPPIFCTHSISCSPRRYLPRSRTGAARSESPRRPPGTGAARGECPLRHPARDTQRGTPSAGQALRLSLREVSRGTGAALDDANGDSPYADGAEKGTVPTRSGSRRRACPQTD